MQRAWLTVMSLMIMAAGSASADSVWHVKAGAVDGTGRVDAPFGSLAAVESASAPGDLLLVLESTHVLQGEIALKAGQTLRGVGWPRLESGAGDLITLADDTTVEGLHILDAAGHAVVGRDVGGAVVRGNRIDGANSAAATSLGTGATAGLGVASFPKAVIAFIHESGSADPNTVLDNRIVGADAGLGGAGVALHARGTSIAELSIAETVIENLGAGFPRSGILIDAQDDARVRYTVEATSVGNAFESSDGLLSVAQHRSQVDGAIRRYRFAGGSEEGLGSNGIEIVTYHGRNWLAPDTDDVHAAQSRVLVEESDIVGAGGFGFVIWNIFGRPAEPTVVDLGGGALGGRGLNRILANGTELPFPGAVYVVHDDLDAPNNFWGAAATEVDGTVRLDPELAFVCRGSPDQRETMTAAMGGRDVWSTFCQGQDVSTLLTAPALAADPRPE